MSLRARLTFYYTLFFALVLILVDVALYFGVQRLLLSGAVADLRVRVTLVQQAYQSNPRVLTDPAANTIDLLRSPRTRDVEAPNLYVQIADTRGNLLVRSSNLGTVSLPLLPDQVQRTLQDAPFTVIERVGAARVLSLLAPLRDGNQLNGVIQVAESLVQVDKLLTAMLWALMVGGAIALLVAARGSLWIAGAALAPINEVSATAERIMRAKDLNQRVPDIAQSDEIGRLTRTINELLARLERLLLLQQRFTADVAHELRTPLAAMRGNLEILRRGAQHDPILLSESLLDIESEVLRLARMADDLLTLAKADSGVALRIEPVQLDDVVLEVYRDLRPLAPEIDFRVELQGPVMLQGDRDRIKQALLNLVANALQHTPAHGRVVLQLSYERVHVELIVTDTGAGIPPGDLPAIFDRFYRADRSRGRGGAGLGLAIVKWIVEAHGGTVAVHSDVGRGTTFVVKLLYQPPVDRIDADRLLTEPGLEKHVGARATTS